MTAERGGAPKEPLVVHVVPTDLARGAQRFAAELRDRLDGKGARHRILTLFAAGSDAMRAEDKLGVRRRPWARLGLEPAVVPALRRRLRALGPDVVVAHGSEPLKYVRLAAPSDLPVVYHKIGVVHAPARRLGRKQLHALLLRRATVVAAVSHECLEEAATVFGVPRSRLVFVPNGRDASVFHPRSGPEPDRPRLVFVGHLTASKRPGVFLDVAERLRAEGVAFDAAMVGDGPLLGAVRERGARAGVAVLGRREDVPALLRESSVFLFTSVPEGEGMPGVFIEAGLSGLPTVCTDVPGARTVIADGETGFVVRPDDVDGLARRTRTLLVDGELRASMGARARLRCHAEFTLERSAERWRALLDGLVRRDARDDVRP